MVDRMKGVLKFDSLFNFFLVVIFCILEVVLNLEFLILMIDFLIIRIYDELVLVSQDVVFLVEDLYCIGLFFCVVVMEVIFIFCNVSRESLSVSDLQDVDRDNVVNIGIMEVFMIQLLKIFSCVLVLDLFYVEGLEVEYENQIVQVLEKLRKVLEVEYVCVEKLLYVQKRIIIEKYWQFGNMCGDVVKSGRVQVFLD